jgi:hypothetical protein
MNYIKDKGLKYIILQNLSVAIVNIAQKSIHFQTRCVLQELYNQVVAARISDQPSHCEANIKI